MPAPLDHARKDIQAGLTAGAFGLVLFMLVGSTPKSGRGVVLAIEGCAMGFHQCRFAARDNSSTNITMWTGWSGDRHPRSVHRQPCEVRDLSPSWRVSS